MERKYHRRIIAYSNYFKDFKKTLDKKALQKIYETFILIMSEEMIPTKYFKKISGHQALYEIRVEYESNIYRIFCCFDNGDIIVLFNGFQKKTTKTPSLEVGKAERIMREYFTNKH